MVLLVLPKIQPPRFTTQTRAALRAFPRFREKGGKLAAEGRANSDGVPRWLRGDRPEPGPASRRGLQEDLLGCGPRENAWVAAQGREGMAQGLRGGARRGAGKAQEGQSEASRKA